MQSYWKEKPFEFLRRFNIIMGTLHLIQVILMLILSEQRLFPITSAFLEFNVEEEKLYPATQTLFEIELAPLVALFLALSAVAHFTLAFPAYEWYKNQLSKGMQLGRWVEYAFSSSVMIIIIAILFGMYDFASLILIFFLNATMILFGWMMEVHNQTTEKVDWTGFIFGCIAGIGPWIALGVYFLGTATENNVPDFVYTIYFVIFAMFNLFGIVQYLQYKKIGPWKDYMFGELTYIILSLTAKSILAWQVFQGALNQPV